MLSGPDVDPDNHGSTFWPSPQSDWGWPPPAAIDRDAYAADVQDGALVLRGTADPATGLAVTKRLRLERGRAAVHVDYVLHNLGPCPRTVAPWEITRVPFGGLVLFPTGDGGVDPKTTLPVLSRDGVTWCAGDGGRQGADAKLFADGAEGWMAYAREGLLFVKAWADVPPGQQAPGEGEVEVYANGARTYLELEQQGPYGALAPGASTTFAVRWLPRAIPEQVPIVAGSEALVALARSLLG
jgi:hypothetical protein